MKIFYIFLVIIFINACSTSDKNDQKTDTAIESVNDEDFIKPKEMPFRPHLDHYAETDNIEDDSLKEESLARLANNELEKVSKKSDNPVSQALSYCYAKDFNESSKILDNFYDVYKGQPVYWNAVGTCYYLESNLRKAMLFYNKALDIEPNYAPAINNLGVIYLKENNDQKAFAAFEKAAKINNFSLTPIFNLAHLYLQYGLIDKAMNYYNVLYKQNKFDIDILSGMANVYLFQGKIKESLEIFNSVEDKYLKRPDISLNYAVALKLAGNEKAAREVFSGIDKKLLKDWQNYYQKVSSYIGEKK